MQLLLSLRTAFLLLCGLIAFSASVRGQQNPPQKPSDQGEDVIRVKTDLVQTGVMVFDKQGRFVDGLQREQFELKVDETPQSISFFEQVKTGSRREEKLLAASSGVGTDSAADETRTVPVRRGRSIVFFLDDLHLSLDSLGRTRQMLNRFIDKEMTDGDLVAIASTSGQLGFLQQFTNNKAVLRAAVGRLRQYPYNVRDMSRESTPMTEYMALTIERKDDPGVFNFYVDECLRYAPQRYPRRSCEVEVINRARQILLQASTVISNTYDSLKSLMVSSAQLPGRKLVFFISDGFLLDTGPRNSDPRGKVHEITDAAQRTGVVIYTIDARGLISGQLDATNNVPMDPNGRLESASLREIPASQDALHALAIDTGGRALRNQNVFDPWINKILDETSNYYLLAWRPSTEEQTASDFHNINVSIAGHPEYVVRLPRGFLKTKSTVTAATTKKTQIAESPQRELQEALGAPHPKRELLTSLSLTYLDTPEHGLVLTASTQVADDGLMFETAAGRQTATVDLVGVVLNEKGKPAASFQTRLTINSSAETTSLQRPGSIYNYRAPLAPGLYQVRVAARDSNSGHIGSVMQWIEIPDLGSVGLALSSLLVGVREAGANNSTSPQLQFSVDHRFQRNSRLRFLCFVYNLARTAASSARPDVAVQAQILRDGQSVLTIPLSEITVPTQDATRIPYVGDIPLTSIPSGEYVLQIIVTDRSARTSATQQTNITVE
jgi:VWFA-related protein